MVVGGCLARGEAAAKRGATARTVASKECILLWKFGLGTVELEIEARRSLKMDRRVRFPMTAFSGQKYINPEKRVISCSHPAFSIQLRDECGTVRDEYGMAAFSGQKSCHSI
jgi:hypothetical protein